jgi:hypothetical protein
MVYFRIKDLDLRCKRCNLSTGQSIFGQAEVPLDDVCLAVISAYPGKEELKQNISLAPIEKGFNAGKFFRLSISATFDNDDRIPETYKPFIKKVFITNAIKCSPAKGGVKPPNIAKCRDWLEMEMRSLPPNVPILLAASEAVKSILGSDQGLYTNRRKTELTWEGHPLVVTFNPIEPLRYALETQVGDSDKFTFWKPVPYGEMRWHYMNDLELIKTFVIRYLESKHG